MVEILRATLASLLLWQAPGATARPAVGAQVDSKALAAAPWSEPLFNLRIRMAPQNGNEYRHGEQMPLLVEMQNVGDAPIKFADLSSHCRIRVEEEKDQWLGIASRDIAISPWEGSDGSLRPRESIRWTIGFDRLRLNKPATGSKIQVRISVPWQLVEPGKLPRTNYCPPVTLELKDAPFTIGKNLLGTKPEAASERWTDGMDLIYRQQGGLGSKTFTIHIDGQGAVTLLDCGTEHRRAATKLNRERLDRLAAFIKQSKVWEATDLPYGIDAPRIYVSLAYGGSSYFGQFSPTKGDADHVWRRLQTEMRAVIDEAVKQVAAAP
jgi:hypothetical protein